MKNSRRTRIFLDNCDVVVDAAYAESVNLKNDSKNENLKSTLEMLLEMHIGKSVKVHFFGSRMAGLGDAKSDLDIYVEIGNSYYLDKNVERDGEMLRQIADALQTSSLWSIKLLLTKASKTSVPVLKTIYVPHTLECDIVTSNGLGVENSLILAHLFGLQPEAIKFYHFMKMFLPRYDIKFDGYLLKLLVIFYFQREDLMPSITEVQRNLVVKKISDCEVQFDKSRTLADYKKNPIGNYKHHIPNFFGFYADFDYYQMVMSVNRGIEISRDSYGNQEEVDEKYRLCIFGPINQKHNIGKYLKKDQVNKFIMTCDGVFYSFLQYHRWHNAYLKKQEEGD